VPQGGQMLGHIGLLHVQEFLNVADALWPLCQLDEDRQPNGVPQDTKEGRLFSKVVVHAKLLYTLIFAYSNMTAHEVKTQEVRPPLLVEGLPARMSDL